MSTEPSIFDRTPSEVFVAINYAASVFCVVFFTLLAMVYAYRANKRQILDTEAFLTARGTQSWARIGWSFFAGSIGAWAIALPTIYSVTMGYFVIPAYALSIGLPCILVAVLGKYLHQQLPRPLSLSDFTNWRFGKIVHILIIFLCLFNMSLALLSEYSILSSIFKTYLRAPSWPIMFLMGICTLLYSSYGGLATSILTDQFQGVCALLFTAFLAVYLAVTFRPEFPQFPERLREPESIWSFFTLTLSLAAAVLYSESFWQRVWASKSSGDTKKASLLAFGLSFVVISFFGICGLLAAWAFDTPVDNFIVFRLLPDPYSWVGGFLVILVVIMNQGCIDSLQNGLAATLAATFCKDRTLWVTRLVMIFVNIPCLILGYLQPDVEKVFLLSNLLTSCAFLALVVGVLDVKQKYIHSVEFLSSFVFSVFAVTLHGLIHKKFDFVEGIKWGWWLNNYDKGIFLSLLGGSILGILLSILFTGKLKFKKASFAK